MSREFVSFPAHSYARFQPVAAVKQSAAVRTFQKRREKKVMFFELDETIAIQRSILYAERSEEYDHNAKWLICASLVDDDEKTTRAILQH